MVMARIFHSECVRMRLVYQGYSFRYISDFTVDAQLIDSACIDDIKDVLD